MSMIATAHLLNESELPQLIQAARPQKKSLFRKAEPGYREWLTGHANELPAYEYDGIMLVTAMVFLEGKNVDMFQGLDHEATELTNLRGATNILLAAPEKARSLAKLASFSVSDDELVSYCNDFFQTEVPEAAVMFRSAFRFLAECLLTMEPGKAILIEVG